MKKGKIKEIIKKKQLYKDLLALATGAGIIALTAKSFGNQKNEFQTYKGKRDLRDYKKILQENNIDYINSYAIAEGDIVKIYVKTNGTHIVTRLNANTIDKITELYEMDKEDFLRMNNLKENETLKTGTKLKIYWYKEYDFLLEDLDESSKWIYHYVMPGETLSGLSDYYDISIEEIEKNNKDELDDGMLLAYSTIKIPKKEKIKKKVN